MTESSRVHGLKRYHRLVVFHTMLAEDMPNSALWCHRCRKLGVVQPRGLPCCQPFLGQKWQCWVALAHPALNQLHRMKRQVGEDLALPLYVTTWVLFCYEQQPNATCIILVLAYQPTSFGQLLPWWLFPVPRLCYFWVTFRLHHSLLTCKCSVNISTCWGAKTGQMHLCYPTCS